ncbi:unnamed protein product [Urochloa humidicola]
MAAAAARRAAMGQLRSLSSAIPGTTTLTTGAHHHLVQARRYCAKPDKIDQVLDLLKGRASAEGVIDSGSLKDIESRILTLETVCNFYKKFQWLLVGPIVAGLVMTVPPTIDIFRGVSEVEKRQKNTAEKLSNLTKRIEYLEGRIN